MIPENPENPENKESSESQVEPETVETADNEQAQTGPADQSNAEILQDNLPPDAENGSASASESGSVDGDQVVIDQEAVNEDGIEGDDPLGFGHQRMGDDGEPEDEATTLRKQLTESEAKAAENWDRLLRLQAEMENQRKRAQNDVTKARKFALEGIVNDLLPVKDSLEMGLAAASAEEADAKAIVEGAELTLKMLSQVFEKNNILEVNPVDEKFNPEFHQAMSMQEIEGKEPNTVTGVMQKGYTLNERLVRPALVMVSK